MKVIRTKLICHNCLPKMAAAKHLEIWLMNYLVLCVAIIKVLERSDTCRLQRVHDISVIVVKMQIFGSLLSWVNFVR